MKEIEEKIKRIINSLSKEELIELKNQIMEISNLSNNSLSNDESIIRKFHYEENKKADYLKRF